MLRCAACGETYPTIDGVPSFVGQDEFYENKFVQSWLLNKYFDNPRLRWPYRLLVQVDLRKRRTRYLLRSFRGKHNLKILDVGCGGGKDFLTRYGQVVGVDLSLTGLKNAARFYPQVIRASVTDMPFDDGEFDVVLSSDLLGHVPIEEKPRAYSEMSRVLAQGGLMIHAPFEVLGDNPWTRFARKYPELYEKHHVDSVGHVGMEPVEQEIARFEAVGCRLVDRQKLYALVLYCGQISQEDFFNNEYRDKSRLIDFLVAIDSALSRSRVSQWLTNSALGLLADIIEPVVPWRWATGCFMTLRKDT